MLRFIFGILIVKSLLCLSYASEFRLRHQYKHSFNGSSLTKGSYQIPFWNLNGDSVPGTDQVRLVPSLRDKSGGVWSKYNFPNEQWQVEVVFRIHGRGKVGADGMVVWLVEEPGVSGSVFGSKDQWKGLGVFLDSYDNDGKKNNPYISVIMNDGTKSYNHQLDGIDEQLGGCQFDIRNRVYTSKLRLTYWKKSLKVEVDKGNSDVPDYEHCTVVDDVEIPKDYFFGVTAATGGLADDHDVISFTTHSLLESTTAEDTNEQQQEKDAEAVGTPEEQKEEEDYLKKMKEFEDEAKMFKEEHPDLVRSTDPVMDEETSSPELRAILDVQSQIKAMVTSAMKVMQTISKRQDEMLPKLEQQQQAAAAAASAQSTGGDNAATANVPSDYVSKSDMKNIIDTIKLTLEASDELKAMMNVVTEQGKGVSHGVQLLGSRVEGLNSKTSTGATQSQQASTEALKKTKEQLDYISALVLDVKAKQNKEPKLSCPPQTPQSCLPVGVFVLVAFIQIVIIIGYQVVKTSQEAAAKKFF